MPVKSKIKNTTVKKIKGLCGVIDPNLVKYENHPFFVKKAAEMKALIDKVSLPKEFYDSIKKARKTS